MQQGPRLQTRGLVCVFGLRFHLAFTTVICYLAENALLQSAGTQESHLLMSCVLQDRVLYPL